MPVAQIRNPCLVPRGAMLSLKKWLEDQFWSSKLVVLNVRIDFWSLVGKS